MPLEWWSIRMISGMMTMMFPIRNDDTRSPFWNQRLPYVADYLPSLFGGLRLWRTIPQQIFLFIPVCLARSRSLEVTATIWFFSLRMALSRVSLGRITTHVVLGRGRVKYLLLGTVSTSRFQPSRSHADTPTPVRHGDYRRLIDNASAAVKQIPRVDYN